MSWLQDFSKLHVDIKGFVFSVLLISPLWYISIYLFHRSFFNSSPIYLPIVFAYCFTICSVSINYLSCILVLGLKKTKGINPNDKVGVNVLCVFFTMFIVAYCIVRCKQLGLDFYKFLE